MAKEKNLKSEKNNTNKRSFKKDFKAELKKVVWPTSKQMVNNVTAVITIVIITAVIVFVLDLAFGAMNNYGINKLKEKVQSKNETKIENVVDNTTIENTPTEGENQSATSEESGAAEATAPAEGENTPTENAD